MNYNDWNPQKNIFLLIKKKKNPILFFAEIPRWFVKLERTNKNGYV